jgi:hypothetical protein
MDNVVKFEGFKKAEVKEGDVPVMNFMFEIFLQPQHPAYQAFVKLKSFLLIKHSYYIDVFINRITASPEMKAYVDRRTQIIEDYRNAKIDEFVKTIPDLLGEERQASINGFLSQLEVSSRMIPDWDDLLKLDSGLRVSPVEVNVNNVMVFQEPDGTFKAEKNLDGKIQEQLFPFVVFKGSE